MSRVAMRVYLIVLWIVVWDPKVWKIPLYKHKVSSCFRCSYAIIQFELIKSVLIWLKGPKCSGCRTKMFIGWCSNNSKLYFLTYLLNYNKNTSKLSTTKLCNFVKIKFHKISLKAIFLLWICKHILLRDML